MTTLPPLSPVARSSPSWLNSTQEMISAATMLELNRVLYSTLPTGRRPSTEKKHNYRYDTRNSKLNYPQVGYRRAVSTVLDDFIYFDKKKTRSVLTIIKNTVTGTLGNCVFPSHVSKGINYYAVARNL